MADLLLSLIAILRPDRLVWLAMLVAIATGSMVRSSRADCTPAERPCRTADRIDPAGVSGPHHCLGRGTSAPSSNFPMRLLPFRLTTSVFEQGCTDFSSDSSDGNHSFTTHPRRATASLRPGLNFRYTQGSKADFHGRAAFVEGFGCRPIAAMRLAPWPASESLQ